MALLSVYGIQSRHPVATAIFARYGAGCRAPPCTPAGGAELDPYLSLSPAQLLGAVYARPAAARGRSRPPFVGLWRAVADGADDSVDAASAASGGAQLPSQLQQQQQQQQKKPPGDAAPPEFDAWAYADYNPRLVSSLWAGSGRVDPSLPLSEAAWLQYKALLQPQRQANGSSGGGGEDDGGADDDSAAAAEGPYCRRLPVVLSYSTSGLSFCHQIYTHVAAWALAAQLGADVLVPPATVHNVSAGPAPAPVPGGAASGAAAAPFEALFDWPGAQELLRSLGVQARLLPTAPSSRSAAADASIMDQASAYLRQQLAQLQPQGQHHQLDGAPGGDAAGAGAGASADTAPSSEHRSLHRDRQRRQLLTSPSLTTQVSQQALTGLRDVLVPLEWYRPYAIGHLRGMAVRAAFQAAAADRADRAAAAAAATVAGPEPAPLPCAAVPLVHLHLNKPLFALRTLGEPLAARIVQELRVGAAAEHRAAQLLLALAARNASTFHAIHLRMDEGDMQAPPAASEQHFNEEAALRDLARACTAAGLGSERRRGDEVEEARSRGDGGDSSGSVPVYVSTAGAAGPAAGREPWQRRAKAQLAQLGLELLTEEDLLPASSGSGRIAPELQAAADLLVLERAALYVGMARSSMCVLVAQRRKLLGLPPGASVLAGELSGLLQAAAVVPELHAPSSKAGQVEAGGRRRRRQRRRLLRGAGHAGQAR